METPLLGREIEELEQYGDDKIKEQYGERIFIPCFDHHFLEIESIRSGEHIWMDPIKVPINNFKEPLEKIIDEALETEDDAFYQMGIDSVVEMKEKLLDGFLAWLNYGYNPWNIPKEKMPSLSTSNDPDWVPTSCILVIQYNDGDYNDGNYNRENYFIGYYCESEKFGKYWVAINDSTISYTTDKIIRWMELPYTLEQ